MIHDTSQGISFWIDAVDSEVHGCLIYDNGWNAPDRGHGHCIYTQNKDGVKTISGNIMSAKYDGRTPCTRTARQRLRGQLSSPRTTSPTRPAPS